MRRDSSPSYTLAALAASAVPGFEPARVTLLAVHADDLDVAGVIGADGRRIIITAPLTTSAGAQVAKDMSVVEALDHSRLRPLLSRLAGTLDVRGRERVYAMEPAPGAPILLDRLAADDLGPALGATIARIHAVPAYIPERAGIEVFTAPALRASHRSQLRRAEQTGEVPDSVERRWEALLDDDSLWDFEPCFIHGSLSEEALHAHGDLISGITQWGEARIADPAQDVAWLLSSLPPDDCDVLLAAYRAEIPTPVDARFEDRAHVLGEFAIADWLLHGIETGDETIIEDARGMLRDLESDIDEAARAEEAARADERAPGLHAPADAQHGLGSQRGLDPQHGTAPDARQSDERGSADSGFAGSEFDSSGFSGSGFAGPSSDASGSSAAPRSPEDTSSSS